MSVAIKVDHVCKKYGDNIIIPDLTANIKNGEFFTLLGPEWLRQDDAAAHDRRL